MGQLFDDLKEIITVSKDSGMSLSEVIQLMKMTSSKDEQPQKKEETEPPKKAEEPQTGKQEPEKELQKEVGKPSEDETVIDYKKKVEELEKKISDLQKENVSKDLSDKDTKTNNEIIDDITRSFM